MTGGIGRPIAIVARLLLGGLFVFAACMKLSDPLQFSFAVKAFKILPEDADRIVQLATFAVPWTEMIAGLCLILGVWTRSAAAILCLLLLAFIAAIASVIIRGLDVKCSCFGKFEFPCVGAVGACHLIRNGVLLTIGVVVVALGNGRRAAGVVQHGQ